MKLKKISDRIGFTETELKVTGFLMIVLFVGLVIKFFNVEKSVYKQYDYKSLDSLFTANEAQKKIEEAENISSEDSVKIKVLGLSDKKFPEVKKKQILSEKSVDLNAATKDMLMSLPGIGEKTAEKIIEYRDERGRFNRIEEAMKVKGIQSAKFEKIKKYIYVK